MPQIFFILSTECLEMMCAMHVLLKAGERIPVIQDHHLQMCLKRSSVSHLYYVKCGVPIKKVNTSTVNDTVLKCVLVCENTPSFMWQSANTFPKGHHLNMNSKNFIIKYHPTDCSKRNYTAKFVSKHRNNHKTATGKFLIKWALRFV